MSAPTPQVPVTDPEPYPPARHVVRDLRFELEDVGPDTARAHLPITPELCRGPALDPGPLLVVTDVLAGLLVGRVIAPDWMATAQLALHLVDPPGAGDPACTDVVVEARVRRAGRTTIVVEAALAAVGPDGTTVRGIGEGELTFARLPRRDGNLDIGDTPVAYGQRFTMSLPDSGLRGPYRDQIGIRVLDAPAGIVELDALPFVRNSFGAVNGGVVASLAQESAVAVADSVLGDITAAADVAVTYLSQGKVGPLRTAAQVVRVDGPVALVRVEVTDPGLLDDEGEARLVVVAHVHCVRRAG